jgi:hypothetical protein
MLLCLQDIEQYGQKPSYDGLNFIDDAAAHWENRGFPKLPAAIQSRDVGDVTIS